MASFESAAVSAITLVALSGCFVFVRFVARIAFVKHFGPDDILIALAWAAALGLAVVTKQETHNSSQTSSTENGASITNLLRQLWSANITYNLAVLLLKDSLLLQYLRFSKDIGYRRACWALGAIVTVYGLAALFVGIFSCRPIAYSWNSQLSGGKCINFLAFWLFNASFNSATDIIVIVLPIPVLSALQLPRKQMIILASIFVLGAFVCIASIIRLTSVYTATVNNKDNASIAIWSTVEVNVGIICACLPSIRHPLASLWPRIIAARRRLNSGPVTERAKTPVLRYQPIIKTVSIRTTSDASSSRPSQTFTVVGGDEEALTPQETPSPELYTLDGEAWPNISKVIDKDKSLPIPPIPAILRPGNRPSGPRPDLLQLRPQISRSRSYYLADGASRSRPQLPCIPEQSRSSVDIDTALSTTPVPSTPMKSTTSLAERITSPIKLDSGPAFPSPVTSPTKSAPTTALQTPIASPSRSVVSLPHSAISSPARSAVTLTSIAPPIAPASSPPVKNTKIAPWSAPSPSAKTYSYEILGGPRALETADANTHLSTSKSRREHARREKERAKRKEREHQREVERLEDRDRQLRKGERPRGPRDMPQLQMLGEDDAR
ncbi:hypothetical protein LTR10_021671 [Elasticomyces elasticus]|uniref:Rhodopsin domain-containing protein n=1 Tax=Exophiala sideris TaxID=1016849 RepID=A0ABR0J8H7_9EURO|nr:hypothetical protein LTR10_021671 [Elasticomyces elasticus]KAK5022183.1 hypothetical protein LTS07_010262 [Exophiala sideris]KAK5037376.1 hypothetical protein LTR13_004533 [Exophiala sideris]KAK5059039.1 hypothetical protein LTR69_006327 [Exophiala sideris]KAK5182872.1 hypothetical protein LTR44_004581 [Eurotiomycetes sp. CCFEE 6388]